MLVLVQQLSISFSTARRDQIQLTQLQQGGAKTGTHTHAHAEAYTDADVGIKACCSCQSTRHFDMLRLQHRGRPQETNNHRLLCKVQADRASDCSSACGSAPRGSLGITWISPPNGRKSEMGYCNLGMVFPAMDECRVAANYHRTGTRVRIPAGMSDW